MCPSQSHESLPNSRELMALVLHGLDSDGTGKLMHNIVYRARQYAKQPEHSQHSGGDLEQPSFCRMILKIRDLDLHSVPSQTSSRLRS